MHYPLLRDLVSWQMRYHQQLLERILRKLSRISIRKHRKTSWRRKSLSVKVNVSQRDVDGRCGGYCYNRYQRGLSGLQLGKLGVQNERRIVKLARSIVAIIKIDIIIRTRRVLPK
jgi:hypothetical protein